jgi:hypothetical protein
MITTRIMKRTKLRHVLCVDFGLVSTNRGVPDVQENFRRRDMPTKARLTYFMRKTLLVRLTPAH